MKESENAVKVQLLSHVCLCHPVARQAPPSMGFSRQGYWSGLPFLSPGDLLDPGIELQPPALQSHQGIPERGGAHARLEGGMQVLGWAGPSIGGRAPHTQRVDRRRSVVKNI